LSSFIGFYHELLTLMGCKLTLRTAASRVRFQFFRSFSSETGCSLGSHGFYTRSNYRQLCVALHTVEEGCAFNRTAQETYRMKGSGGCGQKNGPQAKPAGRSCNVSS